MKTKLTITIAACGTLCVQFSETGNFCEVRGHVWGLYISPTLLHEPNVFTRRQCGNCKLIQTQRIGAWE